METIIIPPNTTTVLCPRLECEHVIKLTERQINTIAYGEKCVVGCKCGKMFEVVVEIGV